MHRFKLSCSNPEGRQYRQFSMRQIWPIILLAVVGLSFGTVAGGYQHEQHTHHTNQDNMVDHSKHQDMLSKQGKTGDVEATTALHIPNITLTNQHGKQVNVLDDVVGDKIVVINTIFTTCTAICPVMGVQYAQVQKYLTEANNPNLGLDDIHLVSISIDPLNDTPARLAEFKQKFGGQDGWTLLTGTPKNIEHILKVTGLFAADPQEHSPITLVGRVADNNWQRISGLGPAKQIVQLATQLAELPIESNTAKRKTDDNRQIPPAEQYFTNVLLLNQNGEERRFYEDLIKDKTVIIHSFFSTCKDSCPISMRLMASLQERFKDKMGSDLHFLSISLDPQTDTPAKLQAYAKDLKVGDGWQLISGDKKNVDFILKKLGHFVSDIEAHKNTILIGKEATGLWKKAFLLAKSEQLDQLINEVIFDELPQELQDAG